jgi:hypothetical protein
LQPKIQFYTSWKLGSKMHSSPQSRAKPSKRLTRSFQRICALSQDAKSRVGQSVLKSLRHHSANPAHPASSHAPFELGFKQLPSQGWSSGCKSLPRRSRRHCQCRACRWEDAMSACECDEPMSPCLFRRCLSSRRPHLRIHSRRCRSCLQVMQAKVDAIVLRIAGYVRHIGRTVLRRSTPPRAEASAYLPRHATLRIEHLL